MDILYTEQKKTEQLIRAFEAFLTEQESSRATIRKYITDVRTFYHFLEYGRPIDKAVLMEYKAWLMEHYAVRSVNSMLVALNRFMEFMGWERLKIKLIKTQKYSCGDGIRELDSKDYERLLETARKEGKTQLELIMLTLGCTGIRISELVYVTVESVRLGTVKIWNKGKYRIVPLPDILKERLYYYACRRTIKSGAIFRTRSGKPKDRSNIWREMKCLAKSSGVDKAKIFPHNFRHLFARGFYRLTRNLVSLADILGHSSLEITRIYTSEGVEEWKRCIEQLPFIKERQRI